MRELKFRAWDEKNKTMLYNVSVEKNGKYKHCTSSGFTLQYDPSYVELPVMQYIGLNDNNSKEIYEDDIIRIGGEVSVVVYSNNRSCFVFQFYSEFGGEGFEYVSDFNFRKDKEIKILGNKHENPNYFSEFI